MYSLIAPFSWSFDDIGLTYFVPPHLQESLKIWDVVFIPTKNEIWIWVVLETTNEFNESFSSEKLKSIIDIASCETSLFSYQIELIKWISKYYFTPIHNAVNLFFPSHLKKCLLNWKIKLKEKDYSYKTELLELTEKQEEMYKKISTSKEKNILLWGITGSWKTEIYKKIITDYINEEKQVLILIPEIVVWYELWERYKKTFWDDVIVINSEVSEAKKTSHWFDIHSWKAKIVIGTRSSLFYPYKNLWCIIIDEEHDSSYNSDKSPRYKGIEVAEKISELLDVKLILGSGTPSIESIYKANKKKYQLLSLLEKYKK